LQANQAGRYGESKSGQIFKCARINFGYEKQNANMFEQRFKGNIVALKNAMILFCGGRAIDNHQSIWLIDLQNRRDDRFRSTIDDHSDELIAFSYTAEKRYDFTARIDLIGTQVFDSEIGIEIHIRILLYPLLHFTHNFTKVTVS